MTNKAQLTPEGIPVEHIGPVIPDPWDDDEQTDWPNNREEAPDGLGPDEESGEAPE